MSLASWLSLPLFHRTHPVNKPDRRQSRRQPIYSRPTLECLEERTLLDASSGLIGGVNNLAFNAAPASSGILLPTAANVPHSTGVTFQTFPNAGSGSALAATSAFMAQDQANSQFRAFGVNSQGTDFRLSLDSLLQTMAGTLGFGSGSEPNAPWKPNSYNLGLANHQYNYSSQTDLGFSSVPPWHHP